MSKTGEEYSFELKKDLVEKVITPSGKIYVNESTFKVSGNPSIEHYFKAGIYIDNQTLEQSAVWLPPYDHPAILIPLGDKLVFTPGIHTEFEDRDFEFQFTFLGVSRGEVKFGYREFSNKMIRAAFSQEVSYPLSERGEIRFKDLIIDIVDVSGSSIRYKVLKYR